MFFSHFLDISENKGFAILDSGSFGLVPNKASANLYSLIETAKASGLKPYAYLRKVFSDVPNAVTVDDFQAFSSGTFKKIWKKTSRLENGVRSVLTNLNRYPLAPYSFNNFMASTSNLWYKMRVKTISSKGGLNGYLWIGYKHLILSS
ncbi:MAG: transposase domain-containing protein [Nitrospirae bacterium]|nr:transposase domain-containing protein [Magnetococcales bacterium]